MPGADPAGPGAAGRREWPRERLAATYDGPVDLDAIADRHRGETVLVVGPIPAEHDLGTAVVLVEVDADGRRVSPWDVGHGEVRHT